MGKRGKESNSKKVFAGVSHLVGASQGVVDARLCGVVHFDYESLLLVNELASKKLNDRFHTLHRRLFSFMEREIRDWTWQERGLIILLLSSLQIGSQGNIPKTGAGLHVQRDCSIGTPNLAASLEKILPPQTNKPLH